MDDGKARNRRWALLHAGVLLAGVLLSYELGQRAPPRSARRRIASPRATIVLESLWCTPLARTHLRTHPAIRNLTHFNQQLGALILADYRAFQREHAQHERDLTAVNDLFFEYQSGTGHSFNRSYLATQARIDRLSFRNSAQFNTLAAAAATLASSMLRAWPHAARRSARARTLQAWATVHTRNSRHQLHVHAGATISIVYYVSAGEHAGALRLLDARGPRPPFEGDVQISASQGEMVAFPGWLAHEVEAGVRDDVRISVVFNVRGGWEGTDDGTEHVTPIGDWRRSACDWKLDWGGDVPC